MEVAMKAITWWTFEVAACSLLGRHVRGRASGLAKQQLTVSWQAYVRNTGTRSWHLGMEHPGAAGSGEVKACRGGGVVKAEEEAILNNLDDMGLLYPMELEE